MFFRNLSLFRFSAATATQLDGLEEALNGHRLHPLGPMDLSTHGFVPPLGRDTEVLTHAVGNCRMVTLGSEDKLLPAAVVNEELARRVQKIVGVEGRAIGARERQRLKQDVLDELLPRAFARPTRLAAYLDIQHGWAVFDTASHKAAELALSALREALGSFPALPLAPEHAPRLRLTEWLTSAQLPDALQLDDECELRDPAGQTAAVVRCRHQDLSSNEVHEHLRAGKQVSQLGLVFDERLAFVLGEDLVVRKLRFLDSVQDELDTQSLDSLAAEMDARFALMTLELDRFLRQFASWFGVPRPTED